MSETRLELHWPFPRISKSPLRRERQDMVALAQDFGLAPVFETARMYTGAISPLRLERVFGVTSFELG
jgi:hypothetical protein